MSFLSLENNFIVMQEKMITVVTQLSLLQLKPLHGDQLFQNFLVNLAFLRRRSNM